MRDIGRVLQMPYGQVDRISKMIPVEGVKPVSIEKVSEGHFRVDFGMEISGWVRLNDVEGPEGHRVEMKFNGNLYSGDNRLSQFTPDLL